MDASRASPERPYLWHGNLCKAFYWAMVGRPATLAGKVERMQQQLSDIQARGFANTGTTPVPLGVGLTCHIGGGDVPGFALPSHIYIAVLL